MQRMRAGTLRSRPAFFLCWKVACYREAVGEADDEAPLPEDIVAEEVEVDDALDDAEPLGEAMPDELEELVAEALDVAPPLSAFFSTALIRSSSSFLSWSPTSVPLLVATTRRRPCAAETCISFCWLSPLRVLTVAKVFSASVSACSSSLETSYFCPSAETENLAH